MDAELKKIMDPLINAVQQFAPDTRIRMQGIIDAEPSGVLAWGVRSGYILWTREHPGEIPTEQQVRQWVAAGSIAGDTMPGMK